MKSCNLCLTTGSFEIRKKLSGIERHLTPKLFSALNFHYAITSLFFSSSQVRMTCAAAESSLIKSDDVGSPLVCQIRKAIVIVRRGYRNLVKSVACSTGLSSWTTAILIWSLPVFQSSPPQQIVNLFVCIWAPPVLMTINRRDRRPELGFLLQSRSK